MFRPEVDGLPVVELLSFPTRLKHDTLVFLQVFDGKVGRGTVGGVLPREDLPVPTHGATEHQEEVEAPPGPLADRSVAHCRHHTRDVEVPAPEGNVGQLVGVPAGENDVVHQNQHVSLDPPFPEVRLLLQEFVHQCLVPLRKKHPGVPLGVSFHHGLETGGTGGRTDEGYDEVKLLEQQIR